MILLVLYRNSSTVMMLRKCYSSARFISTIIIFVNVIFSAKCIDAESCEPSGTCNSFQWIDTKWKPQCESDGSFSPVQCKGEFLNGRCFCFNPTGARIFGWSWWKSSQNMTCSCSRHAEKLKASRKDVSLHCAENGNYEKLQCDNGLCWCVEPTSGKPIQRAYPKSMMTHLPCYNEKDIGNTYFRQCESKSVATVKLFESLEYHGHKYFYIENVFCDNDGSYGRYKISGKFVHCTWKDGSRIDEYLSAIENISRVNCNCARDSLIFAKSKMDFRSVCSPDGNYEPIQYINGRPFCVDSDGFATGVIGNIGEALKC